jgi:hypothetical protein
MGIFDFDLNTTSFEEIRDEFYALCDEAPLRWVKANNVTWRVLRLHEWQRDFSSPLHNKVKRVLDQLVVEAQAVKLTGGAYPTANGALQHVSHNGPVYQRSEYAANIMQQSQTVRAEVDRDARTADERFEKLVMWATELLDDDPHFHALQTMRVTGHGVTENVAVPIDVLEQILIAAGVARLS